MEIYYKMTVDGPMLNDINVRLIFSFNSGGKNTRDYITNRLNKVWTTVN